MATKRLIVCVVWLLFLGTIGCQPAASPPNITITMRPFSDAAHVCSGQFVSRDLPHVTGENVENIGFFFSNGSGLAVADLDQDGDQDIVLGNLLGPIQLFWNQGNWTFQPEILFEGSVRAVSAVDYDTDGWLDLVFTARNGDVLAYHNQSDGTFAEDRLAGVHSYAYSIDWADIDKDGDLDLVTASYDASLEKQTPAYRLSNRAGVWLYTNQDGSFTGERLVDNAQGLATAILDLNDDGQLDILVGNDFDRPDYAWLQDGAEWVASEPFETTSMSTMSYALADIDNNGSRELFSADMHPYSDAPEIMAQWEPAMASMVHELPAGDPQIMANVVQQQGEAGSYSEMAEQLGINFTGWSWSGKFGDLDQDGLQDFYIVNGMQAFDNFSHLPNNELVEENQAFRNIGDGFLRAPSWQLNSLRGGRSMSMADFDNDGDLDIIVNNLGVQAELFENQLCTGEAIIVSLQWHGSTNPFAIGAEVILEGETGRLTRDVSVTSGYLSGDPSDVHFGFPEAASLTQLTVRWPDGEQSRFSTDLSGIDAGQFITIERRDLEAGE